MVIKVGRWLGLDCGRLNSKLRKFGLHYLDAIAIFFQPQIQIHCVLMGQWEYLKKDCSRTPGVEDHVCEYRQRESIENSLREVK